MGKISFDGLYYDHYGKFGVAFEDSMISAPDGKAKKDYEQWLIDNPQIASDIDSKVKRNIADTCGKPYEGPKSEGDKSFAELTDDQQGMAKAS